MHLTEDTLKKNPNLCLYGSIVGSSPRDSHHTQVPKLAKQASLQDIKEWGLPKSSITHLIFCTTSGIDTPGADYCFARFFSVHHDVNRFMLYQQGCFADDTVLRLAKDIAENNAGTWVLVICSEITAVTFHGPSESHLDSLIGQALFGDSAAALIVGSDPEPCVEQPLFGLVFASQSTLPDSEGAIDGHFREVGLTFHLLKDVPGSYPRTSRIVSSRPLSHLGSLTGSRCSGLLIREVLLYLTRRRKSLA